MRFHVGECFLHLEQEVFRDLVVTGSQLQDAVSTGWSPKGITLACSYLHSF